MFLSPCLLSLNPHPPHLFSLFSLWKNIKDREIELRESVGAETLAALDAGKLQWGQLLASRMGSIASASFTPARLSATGGRRLSFFYYCGGGPAAWARCKNEQSASVFVSWLVC